MLQSTSLLSLSTSLLRFLSSLEMPLRTTRRPESSQDTFNWPSETMRSSTDFSRIPPSPPVVFSHTSTPSSSRPQETREESELFDLIVTFTCLHHMLNLTS